jgi:hypothetical protein
MVVAPEAIVECFSGVVSSIDFCIIGANPCVFHDVVLYSEINIYQYSSNIYTCQIRSFSCHLLRDVSGQFLLYVTLSEREPFCGQGGNFVVFYPRGYSRMFFGYSLIN